MSTVDLLVPTSSDLFSELISLQVKQGAYLSKAPSKCSTIGSALSINLKYSTTLGRTAKDKHSSILRKFVNCGRKKFYNTGP